MEGAPLTNTTDSEDHFTPTKSKNKRERSDPLEDDAATLHRRRHIAREALRHEEVERPQQPLDTRAPRLTERVLEHRQRAPEATQLHGEQHIGHMLLTAETQTEHGDRSRSASIAERVQLRPGTRVETLSRSELLSVSERIAVETTSLRDVYETHLIGEQALRRIIAEYLQGHDIHAAIQREILEHEIDFERDPALRDSIALADDHHQESTQVTVPGKDALNQLLQKAQSVIGLSESDEFNYAKSHARRPAPVHPQRRLTDYIMAITIVLLIILVLVLYFGHH